MFFLLDANMLIGFDTLSPAFFGVLLAQANGASAPGWDMWIPFVVIGLMFYLLLIRPERQKRAEVTKMLNNLKKNDRVVTVGGIIGVVVNVTPNSEEVTIRVDESTNTRLRVLRSAISRVQSAEESADKSVTT